MENKIIVEYSVTDAVIFEMKSKYMGLTIAGLDDREGFKLVHDARMVVKGKRIEVEKRRKELKADALAWGQKVDAEARRINCLLEPIETHLETEERKITDEQKRIKEAAEKKAQQEAQGRVDKMAQVGVSLQFVRALNMPDNEFQAMFSTANRAYAAENERKAKEEAERQAKEAAERKAKEELEARLTAERAEREAAEAALKAERDKLEAEIRKLEEIQKEHARQAAMEQAKRDAAESAVRAEKERAERAAKEEAERQAKEAAERKAKEELEARLKPDKVKLIRYASQLLELSMPEVVSEEANLILSEVGKKLVAIQIYITKSTQEL